MKGLKGLEGKGVFVFCTYGAKSGATVKQMKKALKKSGGVFLGGQAYTASDEAHPLWMELWNDIWGPSDFLVLEVGIIQVSVLALLS